MEPENIVVALSQPLWWHCHAVDDNGIVTYRFLFLTFSSLWANSADDKLMTFFLFFPGNNI